MPFLEGQPSAPVVKPATSNSTIETQPFNTMSIGKKKETGLVKAAVKKLEMKMSEAIDGVEHGAVQPVSSSPISSAEVSPPESGTHTPRLRVTIAPCPVRLTPIVPPKNFGAVEATMIYRSGFPEAKNVEFLETMHLRTILTLVETEPEPDIQIFTSLYDIKHVTVPIIANKEGEIRSTHSSLCEAVLMAINPVHHPLHIHCNRGKHRTGCIVALIRKIQRWPIEDVLKEYDTYANPKARPEDIELIKSFDPESVYEYAKMSGIVERWPREDGMNAPENVWELAAALPPYFLDETPSPSTISEVSTDDSVLMMTRAVVDPRDLTYEVGSEAEMMDVDKITPVEEPSPEVTVEEVEDEDVQMD